MSLVTDASTNSAGAVLQQEIDGMIQPLGFFSRSQHKAIVRNGYGWIRHVSAQKAFLQERGCNAGRCSACDVIILS